MEQIDAMLRLPAVIKVTGLGRSSIYRRVQLGQFPQPVRVGDRCTAWKSSEISAWLASLPRVTQPAAVGDSANVAA